MINKRLIMTMELSYPDGSDLVSNDDAAESFILYIRNNYLCPEESELITKLTVVVEDFPDESPN